MKIVIDGKFLTMKVAGIGRVCYELVIRIDKLLSSNDNVEILIPVGAKYIDPEFKNIKITQFGKNKQFIWQQYYLPKYIRKNHAFGVFLANNAPLFSHGLVMLHDISMVVNPSFFSKKNVLWARFLYKRIARRSKCILTVSNFTKHEIQRCFNIKDEKIEIIHPSWQHYKSIKTDSDILVKYNLKSKFYYFALGSISKNKNLDWILAQAKKNQKFVFVIAGDLHNEAFSKTDYDYKLLENIKIIGYVDDLTCKTLMKYSKAFLFPSFYEGFGIPPLEALSTGTDIVVSNIPVMHEVYGDSAYYVDPNNFDSELNSLLEEKKSEESKTKILDSYSWNGSALKLYKSIQKNMSLTN
jgi:glycosyltransferase involved in cell wall biosynthesis